MIRHDFEGCDNDVVEISTGEWVFFTDAMAAVEQENVRWQRVIEDQVEALAVENPALGARDYARALLRQVLDAGKDGGQ